MNERSKLVRVEFRPFHNRQEKAMVPEPTYEEVAGEVVALINALEKYGHDIEGLHVTTQATLSRVRNSGCTHYGGIRRRSSRRMQTNRPRFVSSMSSSGMRKPVVSWQWSC